MSFGTLRTWRPWSPIVALLWAVATIAVAGAAQAADSHGTDHQSSVATAATSDAGSQASPSEPRPAPPPAAADHPAAPSGNGGGGTTKHQVTQPVTPQPISNADANTGGANGQCPGGPYCSTTDGTASANGNGGGQATGKPCAGCVGKADNKNPHGQMPNASDHNAGYECDTNHGIAKGNPAHSGCTTATQPGCVPADAPPCVTPECVPAGAPPCVPMPPECVPAGAPPCVPAPPCVTGCVSPPLVGSAAPNAPANAVSPSEVVATVLPNTGAPAGLVWLVAAAIASILAGTALLRRGGRAPLARS